MAHGYLLLEAIHAAARDNKPCSVPSETPSPEHDGPDLARFGRVNGGGKTVSSHACRLGIVPNATRSLCLRSSGAYVSAKALPGGAASDTAAPHQETWLDDAGRRRCGTCSSQPCV
jgi:hypothetical protein